MLLDIAINKTAEQSSTFENNEAAAAVDGIRGTDLIEDMCAHTALNETNPWWISKMCITSQLLGYSTEEWTFMESVGK